MTLPPPELSAILGNPALQTVAAIFDAAQKPAGWRSNGACVALSCPGARVVHATAAALQIFGARDIAGIEGLLAAGEGPTARRVRHLAAAEPIGQPLRLERLRLPSGRRTKSINVLCARISTPENAIFLLISIPAAEESAVQPDETVPPEVEEASSKARFLWTLDAEERFGDPHPVLSAAVGDNAPRRGETFDALRRRAPIERGAELARALSVRATFSGLEVGWPSADGRRLRVALAATPAFDRNREFAGYRGFGVIGESDASEPLKSADAAAPRWATSSHGDFAAGETALDEAPVPDFIGAQASVGERANPGFEPILDVGGSVDASNEVASPAPARSPIGRIADAVARLLGGAGPDPAAPAPPSESHGAEIVVLRQSAVSSPYAKVVPIRPGALDVPGDSTQAAPGQLVELSKSERDAFREIAHALVGRAPPSREDRSSEAEPANLRRDAHGPSDPASPDSPVTAVQARPSDPEAGDDAMEPNARAILDRLPVGVIVTRDARTLYLNRPLLDLLGYRNLAHFSAADGVTTIFQGRDPRPLSAEEGGVLRVVKADGQPLAAEGSAQAVVWEGAPATLITLRATGAERTRDGEAGDFRRLLDRAADGVVVVDSAARILSLNRPAEQLFGCGGGEAEGQSLLTLLGPQSHAEAIDRFDGLRRSGEAELHERSLPVAGRRNDGAALALELTLARIGPPDDPSYCALFRDLTREREKERRLTAARDAALAASAAKTDFLNKVSHEIRTPLHAILGIAEVMMEGRFGPIGNERYGDYLKDIHSSGRYMMSIADDLLDLNKIESGRLDLAFAPVDANSLIRECVSLMQPQAARERIIMRLNLFERLPRVVVDERSLKQIMLNLISNAVKFNEPGGQVIVSTAVDAAGQAVIRVRDTGAGMSESEVGLAFEPFSQVGNAAGKGGAGLGLPLTKALVEANRAELTIKSRHQQGTLIELAFPRIKAAQ